MALLTTDFSVNFDLTESPKELKLTDTTDYTGQSVTAASGSISITTPTGSVLVGAVSDCIASPTNDSPILLPTVSGVVVPGNYDVTYTVTESAPDSNVVVLSKTFNFTYVSPEINLEITVDCIKPELVSNDVTAYVVGGITPSITRDHKLFYPASLELSPLTATTQNITTDIFYTQQHQSKMTSDLVYAVASDYTITDQITGTQTIDVSCDASLCDIYCCLDAEFNRFVGNVGVNNTLAEKYLANWEAMSSSAIAIKMARECGKTEDVEKHTKQILLIGNCQPGCGCIGGEPVPVVGLQGGTGSTSVVASGGSPVSVVSNTVGSVTTYTVSLDAAFVATVNSSFNTTLVAGTGITIPAPFIDGSGNKTYTISANASDVPNILSFNVVIDMNGASLPVITISDIAKTGPAFTDTGISLVNRITSSYAAWQEGSSGFILSSFWDTQGALEYKPMITLTETEFSDVSAFFGAGTGRRGFDDAAAFAVEVLRQDSTEMDFRFSLPSGKPLPGAGLEVGAKQIKFQITLIA